MRDSEKEVSNEGGRLVLEPTDYFAKVEYASGEEVYAEGFTDYHKDGVRNDRRMSETADYNG